MSNDRYKKPETIRGTCRYCGRKTETDCMPGSDWVDAHLDCSREARRKDDSNYQKRLDRGW